MIIHNISNVINKKLFESKKKQTLDFKISLNHMNYNLINNNINFYSALEPLRLKKKNCIIKINEDLNLNYERNKKFLKALYKFLMYCQENKLIPFLYSHNISFILTISKWEKIPTLNVKDIKTFIFHINRMVLPFCFPPEILCLCKYMFSIHWNHFYKFYPELLSFPILELNKKLFSIQNYFDTFLMKHKQEFFEILYFNDFKKFNIYLSKVLAYIYGFFHTCLLQDYTSVIDIVKHFIIDRNLILLNNTF